MRQIYFCLDFVCFLSQKWCKRAAICLRSSWVTSAAPHIRGAARFGCRSGLCASLLGQWFSQGMVGFIHLLGDNVDTVGGVGSRSSGCSGARFLPLKVSAGRGDTCVGAMSGFLCPRDAWWMHLSCTGAEGSSKNGAFWLLKTSGWMWVGFPAQRLPLVLHPGVQCSLPGKRPSLRG